jgi:hypothetical protein
MEAVIATPPTDLIPERLLLNGRARVTFFGLHTVVDLLSHLFDPLMLLESSSLHRFRLLL